MLLVYANSEVNKIYIQEQALVGQTPSHVYLSLAPALHELRPLQAGGDVHGLGLPDAGASRRRRGQRRAVGRRGDGRRRAAVHGDHGVRGARGHGRGAGGARGSRGRCGAARGSGGGGARGGRGGDAAGGGSGEDGGDGGPGGLLGEVLVVQAGLALAGEGGGDPGVLGGGGRSS